jgi:hypothetical protein
MGKTERSVYIYEVAKSLGFRFGQEKNKTRPYRMARSGGPKVFA